MDSRLRAWLFGSGKMLGFLFALNCFFVAIKLLGAFKGLGSGYGETLIQELAANPFIGLFIGILITSVIQSSSTTTSITVGLVAAGTMGEDPQKALAMAIPIVMGANIGTSITAMLVSLGHVGDPTEFKRAIGASSLHDFFNLLTVLLVIPLQFTTNFLGHGALFLAESLDTMGGLKFTSPIKLLVDPQVNLIENGFENSKFLVTLMIAAALAFGVLQGSAYLARRIHQDKRTVGFSVLMASGIGLAAAFVVQFQQFVFDQVTATFVTGIALLFAALWAIVKIMRSAILDRVQSLFSEHIFKTGLRAMLLGTAITALVQSSSVTTSLIVPLAGAGLLTNNQVLPYVMGANLGTTITALLAALSLGEVTGLAVALAHLLFNICGISVFYPLRRAPVFLAEKLASWAEISPLIPITVILVTYLGVPVICIFLFG